MIRLLTSAAVPLLITVGLAGCDSSSTQPPATSAPAPTATAPSAAPAAVAQRDVRDLLATCLPLEQVQQLTGLPVTTANRTSAPQPQCEYVNEEILRDQSRLIYGIEIGYKKPFGFDPVEGLGNFAEIDGRRLTINLGNDGLVVEGRQGKVDLAPEKLRQVAEAILAQP